MKRPFCPSRIGTATRVAFVGLGLLAAVGTSGHPSHAQPVSTASASIPTDGVRLVPPGGNIRNVQRDCFSPDGRLFITNGQANTALVWEAATGRLVRRFPLADTVFETAFLPDGDRILTGDATGTISVWSIASGKRLRAFTPRPDGFHGLSLVDDMSVRADGKLVAISWDHAVGQRFERSLHVFNVDTGSPVGQFTTVPDKMRFAPDGSLYVLEENADLSQPSTVLVVIDPTSGQILRRIAGAGIPLGFSADSKRVFVAFEHLTDDKNNHTLDAFWLDTQTGAKVKLFGNMGIANSATLAPDGSRFAVFNDKGDVRDYSAETGALRHEMTVGEKGAAGVAYAPTGDLLVAVDRGAGKLVRFNADGQRVETLGGAAGLATVDSLAPSGGTAFVVTREGKGSRVFRWDLRHNTPAGPPLQTDQPLDSVVPGVKFVTARGADYKAPLWNAQTGNLVATLDVRATGQPVFSPDESRLALPNEELLEVSTADGTTTRTYTRPKPPEGNFDSNVRSALYLPDNERIAVGDTKGRLFIFRRATGELISQSTIHDGSPSTRVGGTADGEQSWGDIYQMLTVPGAPNRLLFRGHLGYSGEYDLSTNRITRVFTGFRTGDLTQIACSPDGKTVAIGSEDGGIRLFDRATGAQTGTLLGHSGDVTDLVFTPDSAQLLSRTNDATIRRFDLGKRAELLTTLVFVPVGDAGEAIADTPEWMVYDRSGFFDGSEGATRRVHFADGARTFAADQFFERYYRAGLLATVLGGGAAAPLPAGPSASDAVRIGAPPLVKIVSPTNGQTAAAGTVEVTIEATEQAKGGVKAIRLYQNGRLIGGPAALRGIAIEAVSGATTTKKFTVALEPGANQLRAVAYSNTDLESAPAVASVTFSQAAVIKPALHVLVVGINAYKDATMNLAYARPDAESIADLFDPAKGGKAGKTLFSAVKVTRLLDEAATGTAILGDIDALDQSAKPDDEVLIYLAGHGETEGDVWYFLPTEMRQMAVAERVEQFGIPWSKIEAAIGKIPARKIVLVLDACKSGAIVGGVRGGVGEQQAMAIMARAQGIHILTASNSQQYAGEVKALGHGILTYALLEALNGKAGQTGDAAIMVRDVFSYVENRVPELSLKYRGEEQYPTPLARGQNFPVSGRP